MALTGSRLTAGRAAEMYVEITRMADLELTRGAGEDPGRSLPLGRENSHPPKDRGLVSMGTSSPGSRRGLVRAGGGAGMPKSRAPPRGTPPALSSRGHTG